jgi:hypothetical protein
MTKRITKISTVTWTKETDAPGSVYKVKVPHRPHWDGKDGDFPFDLTGCSDWERQQIVEAWRQAVVDATDLMETGIIWLERLYTPSEHPGVRATDITGAGGVIPTYYAARLGQRLVELRTAYDGFQHRLAIEARAKKGEEVKS